MLFIAYNHSPFIFSGSFNGIFADGPLMFVITFFVTDLAYYWQHRLSHKFDFLWAIHEVHHSSTELNLTTGARTSWIMPFIGGILYMPLAFLGFNPSYIMVSLVLILFLQWWCHTRFIKDAGPLEGIINTPATHRLHHHPNSRRNYAGFLVLWDRLFNTYEKELVLTEKFGIGEELTTYNPFIINFRGMYHYLRKHISNYTGNDSVNGSVNDKKAVRNKS